MRFLPKSNPLYENISAGSTVVPAVLEKLGKDCFSGYLSHSAPAFEALLVFSEGHLIAATSVEGRVKTGFEALVVLFDKVLAAGGEISIYRLTADLVACAAALIIGTRLPCGDEVGQVDVKSLLARMKMEEITGAVRFYTADRFAVIFYKRGVPIGFYHDATVEIVSSPEEPRRVAALPGARVDAFSTKPVDELKRYDLLQMVNLEKLWETALARRSALHQKNISAAKKVASHHDEAILNDLAEDLAEVASAYLSRSGRELAERLLKEGGGACLLADEEQFSCFLHKMSDGGRAIDGDARVEEMIDLMKSEVTGRLAG